MFPRSAQHRARSLVAVAAALAIVPSAALAQSPPAPLEPAATPVVIPGQYIVVLKTGKGAAAADRVEGRARGRGGRVHRQYRSALNGFAAQLSDEALADVRADPDVAFVEPDAVITMNATQTPATWGLDRIDQRPCRSTTPTTTTQPARTSPPTSSTPASARRTASSAEGRSTAPTRSTALPAADCNGHGTHVAGTVGGSAYGVAKAVDLVAVRVLNCQGSGTTAGVVAGINWVTGNHLTGAPAVANMSLGGGASSSLDTAVSNSISDGVTYAIAAGNDNTNACNNSPARVSTALTVGSTTSTDARSSFSNFGSCLDLFAPGSSITSAWNTNDTATNTISGTSMATPHVAGAAALILQGTPNALPAAVNAAVIANATTGVVTSPGSGSPNRLLYTNPGTVHAATATPAGRPAATAGHPVRTGDAVHRHAVIRCDSNAAEQLGLLGGIRHAPRLPDRAGDGELQPRALQAGLPGVVVARRPVRHGDLDGEHHLQRHVRHLPVARHLRERQRRLRAGDQHAVGTARAADAHRPAATARPTRLGRAVATGVRVEHTTGERRST